jgi:hypothetical protein
LHERAREEKRMKQTFHSGIVLGYIAAQLWNKKGSGAQTVREPIIRRATATNASSEMLRDYLHTYKMFLNKYCNDGLNIRISVHVGVASDSNNTDRFNGTQLKFRCCGHPQAPVILRLSGRKLLCDTKCEPKRDRNSLHNFIVPLRHRIGLASRVLPPRHQPPLYRSRQSLLHRSAKSS